MTAETDTRAELNSCQFLVTRLQDHQIRSVNTEASGRTYPFLEFFKSETVALHSHKSFSTWLAGCEEPAHFVGLTLSNMRICYQSHPEI